MTESAETLQARYYEQSVSTYDFMHNDSEDHEHNLALQYIEMISNAFGLQTFLDGQSKNSSWLHPLLNSTHVLLCAFKETPGKKKG